MKMQTLASCVLVVAMTFLLPCASSIADEPGSRLEAKDIAASLPAKPQGVGAPITDRAAWEYASHWPTIQQLMKDAEVFLHEPTPILDDSVVAERRRTEVRRVYEMPMRMRTTRLNAFAVAEGLENKGRFLPAIEKEISAILDEPGWLMGGTLRSEVGSSRHTALDLSTAPRAWNLATVDYWLGDRLNAGLRSRIRKELKERVFAPYLEDSQAEKKRFVCFDVVSNWVPVCHAGVVGAALAIVESREERARIVQAALPCLHRYVTGFTMTEEGISLEGVGYWDYGFGNYLLLAETLWQNSGGKINLYAGERVRNEATAVRGLELSHGTYPAFADGPVYTRPNSAILWLIKERFGLKESDWPRGPDDGYSLFRPDRVFSDEPGEPDPHALAGNMFALHPLGDRLAAYGIFAFPFSPGVANALPSAEPDRLRSIFPRAGQAVLRDFAPGKPALSLAVKAGNNGEPHGHHNQGSYVVALDGWPLLLDPGSELYTPASFDQRRYESMMNNSLGHSVPVVAGKRQRPGAEARSIMTCRKADDGADVIELDLTPCYDVPELKKLTRTFTFLRKTRQIEIVDEVEFSTEQKFNTAFITNSPWKELSPGALTVSDGGYGLRIAVESPTGELSFKNEPVTAPRMRHGIAPTRLEFAFGKPVSKATIKSLINIEDIAEAKTISKKD